MVSHPPEPKPVSAPGARHPLWVLLFGAGAVVCVVSFYLDNQVIAAVAAAHLSPFIRHTAQFFTRWGDFPPIVGLLLVLLLIGWLSKRPFLIRILLVMLACSVAGGLIANLLRFLTGRVRPSARVPPGWYGLFDHGRWIGGSYAYSSFPSAHTAVAIACIVPLWLLLPAPRRFFIGLPATALALCVAASRILLDAHHLSDVLTSVWLGSFIAVLICDRAAEKYFRDSR